MRKRSGPVSGAVLAVVLIASLWGEAASAQSASPEEGAAVFRVCRACHLVGENAKHAVGPSLNGIVGRRAGAAEGYSYSSNLKELGGTGLTWDEATLSRYLENPKSVVPNGKMVFPGLKEAQQRADVIAYLKSIARP